MYQHINAVAQHVTVTTNDFYDELAQQLTALLADQSNPVSNMAQTSALLMMRMAELNWVGFYLVDPERPKQLVLGPFQGKLACTEIPLGQGVCGVAAQTGQVQQVSNVHEFAGHIACDAETNSEVVVPIVVDGRVIGVLDMDSVRFGRFTETDVVGLQRIVDILVAQTDWHRLITALSLH